MTAKKAIPICIVALLGLFMCMPTSEAFDRYKNANGAGNCSTCHGDFTGALSPTGAVFPGGDKHQMHRSSGSMNADCNLCHTNGDGRNPWIGSSNGTGDNPGLGCVGCHGRQEDAGNDFVSAGLGAGLRQHHNSAGVSSCRGCHSDSTPGDYTPVGEEVLPPYYATVDTDADEPCNGVAQEGINENWTIGDFLGLDNDGDGLYDGADSDCSAGAVCGDGVLDDGEACDDGNTMNGDCCAADCTFESAGSTCGDPSSTDCDNPDTCDGAGACLENTEPDGTVCTDDGNDCTDDVCLAGACNHPASPAGTTCGDPSDTDCDNPDTCDGAGACDANYETAGTGCPDGLYCNGDETCDGVGACADGPAPCDPAVETCNEDADVCEPLTDCGNGLLEAGEECDDGNNVGGDCCAADCTYEAVGSTCGDPSDTDCDNPDTCDGAGACLINNEPDEVPCTDDGNDCTNDVCGGGVCDHPDSPAGSACGDPSSTDCDNPDTCDGAGACDANFEPPGVGCPDGLYCNGDEECDGAGMCMDGFAPCDPAVETCNEDADVCEPVDQCGNGILDPGEECDGGECCAADCTYAAPGFACGDPSDTDCDNPDTCDGAGACDANYEPADTACPDGLYCNGDETCDGAGACVDGPAPCDPAVETCNEDADVCEPVDQCGNGILDPGEECDGGECCAADCTYAAPGFACGDPSDTDCDNPDTCDGNGSCVANYETAGAGCPDGLYCNGDETCDGAGACVDGPAPCDPAVESCNEDTDACEPVDQCGNGILDPGEECDGGECCAADCTYAAPGFACGDGSDTDCDNADTCDGAGFCESNLEDAGFACGDPADTDCDNPDTCDGTGFCESNLEGAGFACGDPADTDCDNPDTCDGTGFCESNLEGAGFACGDPTDTDCDNPDTCDGMGFCESNYEPVGTSCTDGSCDGVGECLPGEICFNELDDDADGLIDCADPDCDQAADGICDTGEPGVCADGTFVCFTPDTVCYPDNQPMPEGNQYGNCNDGLDNDCDDWTDLADPDCGTLVDLDIAKLRATKKARIGSKIWIMLGVNNGGGFDEPRPASIVGMQNGVEVFRTPDDFVVFDQVDEVDEAYDGKTTFRFTFAAIAEGPITWTATILDDLDPPEDQADVATVTTEVIGVKPGRHYVPEKPAGMDAPGGIVDMAR